MVMWEWCCVITTTLYMYFVDQYHPYILLISFLYYLFVSFLCKYTVYNTVAAYGEKVCIVQRKIMTANWETLFGMQWCIHG